MDAIKASVLEKLIRELCPEGVEYRELSELFKTKNGYTPSKGNKEFWENGNIPWFRMDDIRQNGGILSHALQNVTEKAVKGELFPENSLIVATTATIGEHALITVPSLANQQFTCLSLKEEYKNQFVIKFLYYYCFKLDEYCKKNLNQGSLASVDRGKFSKFKFPLPPLPIQQEIVRILDTFTNLTAELTDKLNAELTARRKQYEYYRDELLTFGEDVPKVSLSELARFTYGFTDKAKETGDTRFIRITDIDDNGNLRRSDAKYITLTEESRKYLLKKGDILLARTGATYGKTLYIPDDTPAVFASFLIKIELDNSRILNRYYWHFAKSTQYWTQAEKYVSKAGQQQFNSKAVGRVLVPIPPLGVQQKIVDILDKFDKLCADIGDGLPAEIEARQRQYEYYRGQLLKFDN